VAKCIYVKEWPSDLVINPIRDVAVCYRPLISNADVGSTDGMSQFIWKFLDLYGTDEFKIAIFPNIKEAKKVLKIIDCYHIKGKVWNVEPDNNKIQIDFIDYEEMAVILAERKLKQT
jgi:hypothetical protein